MVNSVVVVGRVGQDPEMRYFDNGKVKTTFSLAVNRWDSRTKEEITDWFNIEVWDKQAEVAGEWVKKRQACRCRGKNCCKQMANTRWRNCRKIYNKMH